MKAHTFIPTLACGFGCELWPLMGELSLHSSSLLSQTYNLVGEIDGEVQCDAVWKRKSYVLRRHAEQPLLQSSKKSDRSDLDASR